LILVELCRFISNVDKCITVSVIKIPLFIPWLIMWKLIHSKFGNMEWCNTQWWTWLRVLAVGKM